MLPSLILLGTGGFDLARDIVTIVSTIITLLLAVVAAIWGFFQIVTGKRGSSDKKEHSPQEIKEMEHLREIVEVRAGLKTLTDSVSSLNTRLDTFGTKLDLVITHDAEITSLKADIAAIRELMSQMVAILGERAVQVPVAPPARRRAAVG